MNSQNTGQTAHISISMILFSITMFMLILKMKEGLGQ